MNNVRGGELGRTEFEKFGANLLSDTPLALHPNSQERRARAHPPPSLPHLPIPILAQSTPAALKLSTCTMFSTTRRA